MLTIQGKYEIKCKLLTKINSLRYLGDAHYDDLYEPGYVTYMGEVKDERTEV